MASLRSLRCMLILCLSSFTSILFTFHYVCRPSSWSCREIKGLDAVGRFYGQAYETVRKAMPISCSPERSRRYLSDLCKRYHQGEITGSICKPLCDSKEISYLNCFLGGRDKIIVILASWGQKKTILKATKLSDVVTKTLEQFSNMSILSFKKMITTFVESRIGIYRNKSITEPVLDRIVSECDVGGDGALSGSELQHCGRLIQPGLILHTMFNKSTNLVPDIYGSCGELLSAEFASSDPLYAGIIDMRPWHHRAQLALALLDYIQELEHTAYGTLYLCDLQWKNLGVVTGPDGRIGIKSIDNDKLYFGRVLERRVNKSRQCQVDYDCRVVACHVECNKTTHTCSRKLSSNNLELVCRIIFWSNLNEYLPGLLSNPPTWMSSQLQTLRTRCLESGKYTEHISQDLIDQFYILLWQSHSN